MLEQRHEEESVRMESDILKIKVHTNVLQIKFKLGWTSSKPQIRV